MSAPRVERVARQLHREITTILKEDLKDPRVGFVTVTDVELSGDLRHAKILLSIMGTPEEQEKTFEVLSKAVGFLRTQVGQRMRFRYTPELFFVNDKSMDYADRIFKILDEIKAKELPHGTS